MTSSPGDLSPLPGLQRSKLDCAECHTHQLRYRMPERLEHPPDFAVLALDELDDRDGSHERSACGRRPSGR